MTMFPRAMDKRDASVTLALAHYILCRVNSGEPLDLFDAKIQEASSIGSRGGGSELTDAVFDAVTMEFQHWYAQDQVELPHVFDSLVAAAQTLRAHWASDDAGKERLLLALESLAEGQHTDFGEQSLRAVERHLGVDDDADDEPDGDADDPGADADDDAEPTGDMLLDFLRAVGIWPADLDPWTVENPTELPEGFEAATAALIRHIRQSPSWFELPRDATMDGGLLGLNDPAVGTCSNEEFSDLMGANEYPWHKRGPLWYSSRMRINEQYDGPVLFLRDAWVAIDPDDEERFTVLSWDDFLGHRLESDGMSLGLGAAMFVEPVLVLTHQDELAWSKASLAVAAAVLSRLQPVAAESLGESALRHPTIEPWTSELLQQILRVD